MQSQDRTWMFNENSTNHRGVWHIIEGELATEVVPEEVFDYDYGVWSRHKASCGGQWGRRLFKAGKEPYTYNSYEDFWDGCDCELATERVEKKVGTFMHRSVSPEHEDVRGQPVLCHQAELWGSTLLRVTSKVPSNDNRKDGGMHVTTHRLVPFHLYEGELPPGPTCSRCLAKAERDGI